MGVWETELEWKLRRYREVKRKGDRIESWWGRKGERRQEDGRKREKRGRGMVKLMCENDRYHFLLLNGP